MPDPERVICDIDDPLPVGAEIPVSIRILEAGLITGAVVLERSVHRVRVI
jgi:hypothetical protein